MEDPSCALHCARHDFVSFTLSNSYAPADDSQKQLQASPAFCAKTVTGNEGSKSAILNTRRKKMRIICIYSIITNENGLTLSTVHARLFLDMIFTILITILSILLIGAILMQAQGTGLGAGFGGGGEVFRTKRGVEKKLHTVTIILAILFFGASLANILF